MLHGTKEWEVSGPQAWGEIVRRVFFRLEGKKKKFLVRGYGWSGGGRGVDLR